MEKGYSCHPLQEGTVGLFDGPVELVDDWDRPVAVSQGFKPVAKHAEMLSLF